MKILNSTQGFAHDGYLAVALGNFDGLHLGHRELLRQAKALADKHEGQLMMLTFWPHPMGVVGDGTPALLMSREEKRRAAERLGVDYLLELPFTEELAALRAEDFVEQILHEQLQADLLAVGFNFHFGAKGKGSANSLKHLGELFDMETLILPPCEIDGEAVSSSRIRELLADGQVRAANRLLDYNFALCGEVEHGQQLGRRLGFPTANMSAGAGLELPAYGVYAARATVAGAEYTAVVNIGVRPTVGEFAKPTIEAHLLDVDGLDLYGEQLRVELVAEIRRERAFAGLDELKAQMARDKAKAAEILR